MNEIDDAIAAFENDPSDENAQGINLATMVPASIAFSAIGDGIEPEEALMGRLEKARIALTIATQTELIQHYAKAILFRINVINARKDRDLEKVRSMINKAKAA